MNNRLYNRLLDMSFERLHMIDGKTKHFTFLVNKNRIVHMGWNDYNTSHPILQKLGYGLKKLHSEVAAILPFRNNLQSLAGMDIVNTRVNTFGEIKLSKPCIICAHWVGMVGFKNIYYTDNDGELQKV